jgi:uncharacterized metal-binding protein
MRHAIAVLTAIVPLLCACESLKIDGVTCTVDLTHFACGVTKTLKQDLLATGVAKDEKPDRPFGQPSARLAEAAP